MRIFDGDHERRRKQQLVNLYDRTEEQVRTVLYDPLCDRESRWSYT